MASEHSHEETSLEERDQLDKRKKKVRSDDGKFEGFEIMVPRDDH